MIRRKIVKAATVLLLYSIQQAYTNPISLSIEQAYELCISNSLELKSSRYELQAERRKLALGYWESLPSLSMSLSDSRLTKYNASDTSSISLSSSLSIPVFNGGRVRMQRNIQKLSLDIQTMLLSAGEDELKNNCFSLFYEMQVLYLQRKAIQETVSLAEQQYRITEKEFELGKAREIDLVDTQLNLDEISQELFSLESDILSNEYSFRKLLGLDDSADFVLVSKLDERYTGIPSRDLVQTLYDSAEQKNSTLVQGRFAIEQARINNRLLSSAWLPNIELEATVQLTGDDYPLQNPNYGLRAIIELPNELLPVNLSFGISTTPETQYGRSSSTVLTTPTSLTPIVDKQLARMKLLMAVEEYSDLQRDLRFSLEQLMLEYERQQRSQEILRRTILTQEKKVSILLTQAELGQITRIDYLEGENELLASRLQYLSGILSLIQMEQQLETLAGLETGELHTMRSFE